MEEFLTKVAALGRIPEPELGKVQACASQHALKHLGSSTERCPTASSLEAL